MPEVSNHGIRISYDAAGEGRPLMLLHGWCCDRSWWTEPGYVDDTQERSSPRLRRHPRPRRERQAARSRRLHRGCPDRRRVRGRRRRRSGSVRDLGAVLRRMDRVDDRGRRPGAGPGDRGLGIVGSATQPEEPTETDEWDEALRHGGTSALVDLFKERGWRAFDREFPPWARAVTLRADPEALLAAHAPELWDGRGSRTRTSGRSPSRRSSSPGSWRTRTTTPRRVAAMIPNGQSLRLPGLGHGGACAASALTVPTARAFLDRWFA